MRGSRIAMVPGMSPVPDSSQEVLLRMLVVDDEDVISCALQTYFSLCGYQVDVAAEREEALALLAIRDYDVVIADLRLKGTHGEEGLDVLRWARRRNDSSALVLLTAYGTPSVETKAFSAGADALLPKTRPLPEIASTVSSLMEARRR